MKTGMVSVTFRELEPEQIIRLTKDAGLDGIEWGSDIHVPVGDLQLAEKVAGLMNQAGLDVLSYGSYYRLGEQQEFDTVLETAAALGAPNIRVWAGVHNSQDAADEYRKAVVTDARQITEKAWKQGITISTEYHGGTLTNTQQSTVNLLEEVGMDSFYTYWQPLSNTSFAENLENIQSLCRLGKLKNIHAYHWVGDDRLPLQEGRDRWNAYFMEAAGGANAALLEFVRDNSVQQFYEDAALLKQLIGQTVQHDIRK